MSNKQVFLDLWMDCGNPTQFCCCLVPKQWIHSLRPRRSPGPGIGWLMLPCVQDYTYYFVPAPWLSVKLLRLLQNYPQPEDPGVRGRLSECLETILNKAQEPPKSKKIQHSNAKNAVNQR